VPLPLNAANRPPLAQLNPNVHPAASCHYRWSIVRGVPWDDQRPISCPPQNKKNVAPNTEYRWTGPTTGKQKEVYDLTHFWATILVAKERSKPEGDRCTMSQVIVQIVAEFKLHGLRVTLAKLTINKYVAHGSIGLSLIARGYWRDDSSAYLPPSCAHSRVEDTN
jgi:hypothetical protein